MSVLPVGFGSALGGYQIERSLRFNSADSAYLNRTPASAGNRRTWTWSGWIKRSSLTSTTLFSAGSDVNNFSDIYFYLDNLYLQQQTSGSNVFLVQTQQVFRDVSAWYHVVIAFDTNQGTASNRRKIYINGTQVTALTVTTEVPLDADTYFDATVEHRIGRDRPGATAYYDGYMTEVNFIDGQALTPSSFGETDSNTGVWKPKAYSGTYGTNGFYLNFSDNSGTTSTTLGKDSSGNGNNWTPNNFSVTAGSGNDSLVDSPTSYGTDTGVGGEVRGNYCTLNPLFTNQTGISSSNTGTVTITNGNLTVAPTSGSIAGTVGTLGVSSGKWYFEYTITTVSVSGDVAGFITSFSGANTTWIGYRTTGVIYNNGSSTSGYATATAGDIIGIALDIGGSTISCYKNNTLLATTALNTAITADCFPLIWFRNDTGSGSVNFGQRAFAYTAPSGFKALCTQNLPTPTIGATSTTQANDYMNVALYTGNGSSQTITGVGFQPDFTWIKSRSGADNHNLFNAVVGLPNRLFSNLTNAENTTAGTLTSFNSDGFSVGSISDVNANGVTFVGWNWKANGAGSSNTAGTITSTVSANTTSGFSIVTYTGNGTSGATIGHGLGVAPSMVIIKCRSDGASNWPVYHSAIAPNNSVWLSLTNGSTASSSNFNNTATTSTLVTLGNDTNVNGSTRTYVAYCFAPVAGYSAFGSYVGNGSTTDGPFLYLGFKPKFWMSKRTDSTSSWLIIDGARNTYNVVDDYLIPNASNAEASSNVLDFLSNGVKFRNDTHNDSGATWIYMAFAESPFRYSLAR